MKRRILSNIVSTENEGPSISAVKLANISAAGERGNNTNSFEGSGMGLYFVDKVCKESNINLLIECDDKVNYTYNAIDHSTFRISFLIGKNYGRCCFNWSFVCLYALDSFYWFLLEASGANLETIDITLSSRPQRQIRYPADHVVPA